MRVREVYDILGENYEDVVARLATEERIAKYLKRILEDTTMERLEQFLKAKDYEESFRASHSIKGMAYNLGLNSLGNAARGVCETMRNGAPQVDVEPLMEILRDEYARTCGCIANYVANEGC